jgi:hypothetical protein
MRVLMISLLVIGCAAAEKTGMPAAVDMAGGATVFDPCGQAGVGPSCGKSCSGDGDCGATLYCGATGKCTADCTPLGGECGAGRCGLDGRCERGGSPDMECGRIEVTAELVVPTVELLIDQSGSMTEDFGGVPRWEAMKSALVGAGGVVTQLESRVRFGASLYTNTGGTCPQLTAEGAAMDNRVAIDTLITSHPVPTDGDTPTGESLRALVSALGAPTAHTVIVLVTDGDPDTCAAPDWDLDAAKLVAVEAARDAYAAGFPVYVLSVGGDTTAAHMQDVANAGAGVMSGATYFRADTAVQLADAFRSIIRGARECRFTLSGTVVDAAAGQITLGGTALGAADWHLVDAHTIELVGAACDTFKDTDDITLAASFACGSIVL